MHFPTVISKQRANKGSRAEFCSILLQKLPKHWLWSRIPLHSGICCSDVLLEAGHYSGYKALDSQINSKLQNSPVFFYSIAVSQKAPIYIHWAVICSCFKALSCPSNLLWSQEELADLNRGLSVITAQRSLLVAVRHVISSYSSPWLKHCSWFTFASTATCVATLWPSFIRMLWVKKSEYG